MKTAVLRGLYATFNPQPPTSLSQRARPREGTWMSQPRVIVLCIIAAMTALVVNSTVGYLADREPAVFFGPAYAVLIAAWLVCAIVWILAERDYRLEIRARADDYRMALRVTQWGLADSGSWRRPSRD